MYKPDTYKSPSPGRTTRTDCCTDEACESGLRNNYFEGKRLTPDTFRVEQRYQIERRRLLNRAIHGWGVVYGYAIVPDPPADGGKIPVARTLKVGAGLALDECGRELLQPGELTLALEQVVLVDEKGHRLDAEKVLPAIAGRGGKSKYGSKPLCWLLSVNYAEQFVDRQRVTDTCRCEHEEWDRTCETVRYTLQLVDCEACCAEQPCSLDCKCHDGPCCSPERDEPDTYKTDAKTPATPAAEPFTRGGCRCLCEHLTGLKVGGDCAVTCEVDEPCGRVSVDLEHGVPLACVKLVLDDCDEWTFGGAVEACGPRRLVKRNDLLFDLIRGCDLTRVSEIGWATWHRLQDPIKFEEFSEALGADGTRESEYVTKDFWVKFSRPVRANTLLPDCFAMTAMSVEREGGWWQTFRVPIVRLEMIPGEAGDPEDHVRGAFFVVDGAWVEDGCRGRRSLFLGSETLIEIEVRGDFILDCNGQAVDANARGFHAPPSGNGTPGGTFLSTFRVAAAREAPARPYESGERAKGASS